MDDAQRLMVLAERLVRRVKPGGDLHGDARGDLDRQAAASGRVQPQHVVERAALDVLHREVVQSTIDAELLDMDHVGMADLRADPRLVDEHVHEPRIVGQVRVDHLERDAAGESRRAVPPRQIQRGHPTRPQPLDDLEPADPLPGREHARRCLLRHDQCYSTRCATYNIPKFHPDA